MFSAIRRRMHVSPATVIASLALVFAMTGGAYAAGRYVITSPKQIKPSVLKSLQGKAGPAGKSGVNGTNGAAGPQGAAGAQGPQGPKGETGTAGTDGSSVTSAEIKPGNATHCSGLGGAEFKSPSGTTTACNGKEGSPWTAGGTLLGGQTLKGAWSLVANAPGPFSRASDSVSFDISLAAPPAAHYISENAMEPFYNATTEKIEERTSVACPGSVAEPQAEPGDLCVYASHEENNAKPSELGDKYSLPKICFASSFSGGCVTVSEPKAERFGFSVYTASQEEGNVADAGTWAVTAAE